METIEQITKVTGERWLRSIRWRIWARTTSGRRVVFVIYQMTEPTMADAQKWFESNHGEALELPTLNN